MIAGKGSVEVATRAQQLLEQSLFNELRANVAKALSGLDMFASQQLDIPDMETRVSIHFLLVAYTFAVLSYHLHNMA